MKTYLEFSWQGKCYAKEINYTPQHKTTVIFEYEGFRWLGEITSIINSFIINEIRVQVSISARTNLK